MTRLKRVVRASAAHPAGYGFIPYAPLKRRHSAARSTCADVLGARFSPLGAGVWLAADVLSR